MKQVDCGQGMTLYDLEPAAEDLFAEVAAGLAREPKTLPCKFFYDPAGAALFEAITALPEYYPTRLELGIMDRHAPDMAAVLGRGVRLIEFGSGSGQKTRLLLEALPAPAGYVPIDISRQHLLDSALAIAAECPGLSVQPLCADYTRPFELPPAVGAVARTVAYFPGSTMGNFDHAQALQFLTMVAERVGDDGALVLGLDLFPAAPTGPGGLRPKTVEDIRLAYNDARGVTARFNLNLLERIRRELDADLDPDGFRHDAVFDEVESRIEMRLISTGDQVVRIRDREFRFRAGEWIVTEHSYKYDPEALAGLVTAAGFPFGSARAFHDPDGWFGVYLLLRPGHPCAEGAPR